MLRTTYKHAIRNNVFVGEGRDEENSFYDRQISIYCICVVGVTFIMLGL